MSDEPKYVHLRRYSKRTRQYEQTGGITLSYVREGDWYRVGASYCSLKDQYRADTYQRKVGQAHWQQRGEQWFQLEPVRFEDVVVGKSLAKQRLWNSPCWVHKDDWSWDRLVSHLTDSDGRAWYVTALKKGLGRDWVLQPVGAKRTMVCFGTPYVSEDIMQRLHQKANDWVVIDDMVATRQMDRFTKCFTEAIRRA